MKLKFGSKKKGGKKGRKAAISLILIIPIFFLIIIIGFFALPIIALITIDEALLSQVGFLDTETILETVGKFVTEHNLSKGSVNSDYAADLAENGILVGQVTASGDFVRTNTYIANLDNPSEIASNEIVRGDQPSGELAVMFDDEIVSADDFVAKLDSDPKMYFAYSKALNISARYYYSDEVEEVYRKYGLSRNNFSSWENTGDEKTDRENFEKLVRQVLKTDVDVNLNGYQEDSPEPEKRSIFRISFKNNEAIKIANEVSESTKSTDNGLATEKAANILNASISSSEPYTAAKTFLLVEEAIQRAKIDYDGPVDTLMDILSEKNKVEVYDVSTGEKNTTNKSILQTGNFLSAISTNSTFSQDEALDYSRDRVIKTSGGVSSNALRDAKESSDGSKRFHILTSTEGDQSANADIISKNVTSINNTFYGDELKTFESSIGGNRIVSGGAYLSNLINQYAIGAAASDQTQIDSYNALASEATKRRDEAERATLSPFDTSSKNTFLGSLVRQFATSYLNNYSDTNFPVLAAFGETIASSAGSIFAGQAKADEKQKYSDINGDCVTVGDAGVNGDLYCNQRNTIGVDYISYTMDDYKKALGDQIDENGKPRQGSEFAEFITLGSEREITVGIKSAEVCESYKEFKGGNFLQSLMSVLLDVFGLHDSCIGVPDEVATGAKYTISQNNPNSDQIKLFSSYMTYQMVSSLIGDEENQITAYREEYRQNHPTKGLDSDSLAKE